MLALATLALAVAPQNCGSPFFHKFTAHGTLSGVTAPLAAPLTGAANGDPVTLVVELYLTDGICSTPTFLIGPVVVRECTSLTVGSLTVGEAPNPEPCGWGERFTASSPFFIDALEVDLPLEGGLLETRVRLGDAQGNVGIGIMDGGAETSYPLNVPTITDPGFSAAMDIVDGSGTVVATVDLALLEMEFPTILQGNAWVYCDSNPNSTDITALVGVNQFAPPADNDLLLTAAGLPQQSFGFFLASQTQGFIPNPGGSSGNLCLGGSIGRFVGPGQIQFSGDSDTVTVVVDKTVFPQPMSTVAVQPGQTWNFQYWFRDVGPAGVTSNFSSGSTVQF